MSDPSLLHDAPLDLLSSSSINSSSYSSSRSSGIHLSNIIHYICLKYGHYTESSNPHSGMMSLGQCLELGIELDQNSKEPGRYIRVGELELDGIYMTPDFIDVVIPAVKDTKLTRLSASTDPMSEKFWKFRTQLMGYCHGIQIPTGDLDVTFMSGNSESGGDPIRRIWRWEWLGRELKGNWSMIKKFRDEMVGLGMTGEEHG